MPNVEQSLTGRLVGGPVGFRELLERLGPTYVKIGQFLALRPDLVPQDYCDQLMQLLDRVTPFSWDEARAILREDLGAEPTELFAYVNPRPVAAGSLAQTHVARTKEGAEVAVKIQRPRVRSLVLRDLGRARTLARVLELSGASLVADPRDVVQELRSWLMQEIDFSHELANLTRLYHLAADSQTVRIPRPYPNLSGPRVLTAEYLPGVPVSELLAALHSGRSDQAERLGTLEIDRNRVATNLLSAVLRQIFRYQFFHADIHPGNLLILPDDVVGFVDFGLCSELDPTVRDRQLRYLTAGYSGNSERMFRALAEILIPSDLTDMEAFRRDFLAETRNWASAAVADGRGASDRDRSPVTQYLIALMRTARRHRLEVPAGILAMYRTILTADTVARQLGARTDLNAVGRDFFGQLRMDETMLALEPENLQASVIGFLELLRESPDQLRQILGDLSDGRFTINVNNFETPKVAGAHNRRTRLLATSILAVSVVLLVTSASWPTIDGVSSRWIPTAILVLIYVWILFQWRRLS